MSFLSNFGETIINASDIGIPKANDTNLVHNILMPVYFWAGVLAVIVIIIAGYIFVTSNGNAQQVTRAKQAILGAVVGLIVIFVAFVITNFVVASV